MAKKFDPTEYIRTVKYKNRRTGEITERKILDTGPRLAWFRSEHPIDQGWRILTNCLKLDADKAQYMAEIVNPEGVPVSTGHRLVFKKDFPNYSEKAETQAVGRALANAGYGTLEALEDGDVEVDTPGLQPDAAVPAKREVPSEDKPKPEGNMLEMILAETNSMLTAAGKEAYYNHAGHIYNTIRQLWPESKGIADDWLRDNEGEILQALYAHAMEDEMGGKRSAEQEEIPF